MRLTRTLSIASAIAIATSVVTSSYAGDIGAHFHPKGKAPSRFTKEVLRQAGTNLPFADKTGLRGAEKGLHRADEGPQDHGRRRPRRLGHGAVPVPGPAGGVRQHPPVAAPQSVLNNNYGLYEVIPGIYQVRGFDLADISFVRGKTGWIVFDPLVTAEPAARGLEAVPGARRQGPAGLGGDLFAHARRPLGRRARHRRGGGRAVAGRFPSSRRATSWSTRSPRTSTPATR